MSRLIRQSTGIRDNRCPICDTSITWREARSRKTCGGWNCRTAYRKMQLDSRRKHDEQFHRRYRRRLVWATRLRSESAPALGVQDPESYRAIVTPANQHPIVALTRKRRYRFVKRLIRLVKKTLQNASLGPQPLEDNQQSLPILGAACANCEGKCCVKGGTGAYLDGDAIRRFASKHPEADSRDIVEAYCRSLPLATYRDWRSAISNAICLHC